MADAEPEATKRPHVIIVDDDRDTREMLTLALELEGFEVGQAANGLRLISAMHVDRPDVILLDVMMSWIDGFELCRAIKQNPSFHDIPVIFISRQQERRGRAGGARRRRRRLLPQAARHGAARRADPGDPGARAAGRRRAVAVGERARAAAGPPTQRSSTPPGLGRGHRSEA